ncbi:MAG: tRNA (adenosine(37)-N6)-threonylcarbamoyltransferase complex transferase subunit TsaD [Magnetovibrio sp.]|nr:tRNA (adenosine(37)-N6)-threonylcarbamoyltransferase complex transferase subunit TsaD [Magnetovibrio sp.]
MIVLGIETSCDETAAAIVTKDGECGRILSNVVRSQHSEHKPYGGVVPEVAARAHVEVIDDTIKEAMREAELHFDQIDGIAATGGPGLIGGVMVGTMMGKALSFALSLPFIAVNHLEAHALTVRLTGDENRCNVDFPYILLLVSGGHCQLLAVEGIGQYRCLGTTIDDAVGEAFDKTAKMLGLGYPGGPEVEKIAAKGNSARFSLPRPMMGRTGCDFSFSGLKTKVRQTINSLPPGELKQEDIADLCASFQEAACDVLADRSENALDIFLQLYSKGGPFVVAGGVAANAAIRARLKKIATIKSLQFIAPPIHLCTDNGAMVAWAGLEKLLLGESDDLDFRPRPRWPLDPGDPKLNLPE